MAAAPAFAQNFTSAQKKVRDSVVSIFCKDLEGNISTGTGFFISEDGLLLTCAHVVKGAIDIRIASESIGSVNEATIISALWDTNSNTSDIALLKVMGTGTFTPVKLGDTSAFSAKENTGMEIGVLGYPRALDLAQFGTLSMSGNKGNITALQGSNLQTIIQHDAATNPGNSGGPIFDMHGAVIGIVNAKLREAEGINFAINIQAAKKLIADLDPAAGIDIKNTEQFSSFLKKVAKTVNKTTLSLATRPTKAICLIKETQYVNVSPCKFHLYPGDYTLVIMKDGYKTEERIITVEENKANDFIPDLVPENKNEPVKSNKTSMSSDKTYAQFLPKQTGTFEITSAKKGKVFYLHIKAFYEAITSDSSLYISYQMVLDSLKEWIFKEGDREMWKQLYEMCSSKLNTPCSITVPVGEYIVWLEDDKLLTYRIVTLKQNETQKLYFDNGPRTVRVYTQQEGVSIYNSSGNLVGETKLQESSERPFMEFTAYGSFTSYKITAKKEGFYSDTKYISIANPDMCEVSFALKKDPRPKTFSRNYPRGIFSFGVMLNGDKAFKNVYKTALGGGFHYLSGSGSSFFSWRWFYGINAYAGSTVISKAAPAYMDSGTVVFANSGLGGGVNMAINRFSLYLGLAYDMAFLYEKVALKDKNAYRNFSYSLVGFEADAFAQVMITHTVGITLLYKYHYNPTLLQSMLNRYGYVSDIGGHAVGIGVRF